MQVVLDDAVVAISIVDLSAVDGDAGSVLPPGCTAPTAFEDDPDAAFAQLRERLVDAVRFGGAGGGVSALLAWQ